MAGYSQIVRCIPSNKRCSKSNHKSDPSVTPEVSFLNPTRVHTMQQGPASGHLHCQHQHSSSATELDTHQSAKRMLMQILVPIWLCAFMDTRLARLRRSQCTSSTAGDRSSAPHLRSLPRAPSHCNSSHPCESHTLSHALCRVAKYLPVSSSRQGSDPCMPAGTQTDLATQPCD